MPQRTVYAGREPPAGEKAIIDDSRIAAFTGQDFKVYGGAIEDEEYAI